MALQLSSSDTHKVLMKLTPEEASRRGEFERHSTTYFVIAGFPTGGANFTSARACVHAYILYMYIINIQYILVSYVSYDMVPVRAHKIIAALESRVSQIRFLPPRRVLHRIALDLFHFFHDNRTDRTSEKMRKFSCEKHGNARHGTAHGRKAELSEQTT